ncbi:MAG: hypothetical protein NWE94_03080 [Candidatus Bathyarchaeota archaeon]|nr:hypothetical protein [Candidatus Bathyarchaeota archaeon]
MNMRLTLTLLLGMIQSVIAISAMVLAGVLYANLFNVQSLWDVPQEALNFHLAILLALSIFLIASSAFLFLDWRELRR